MTITYRDLYFMGSDIPDRFEGKVKSNLPACQKHRTVEVYRDVSGQHKLLGAAETAKDGAYEVLHEDPHDGLYYAKVRSKKLDQGTITCKADISDPVLIDDDPSV